jgi:antitoxin (DNA-binding transcriptional repressor) of toxin-antitoxin stability system
MRFNPSVTEVARNFAEYVNRVAFRGERFVLMRGKKPVAELGPVVAGRRLRELPELLASLPRLSAEDADLLAKELGRASSELQGEDLRDPWGS